MVVQPSHQDRVNANQRQAERQHQNRVATSIQSAGRKLNYTGIGAFDRFIGKGEILVLADSSVVLGDNSAKHTSAYPDGEFYQHKAFTAVHEDEEYSLVLIVPTPQILQAVGRGLLE
jgi:hypothetical protein